MADRNTIGQTRENNFSKNLSRMQSTNERRRLGSKPTTPLRRISRGSLSQLSSSRDPNDPFPLDALEQPFAEFSDGLADLASNMEQIQLMHNSLSQFNESFASFLYGLSMNAFCADFPEAPIPESFKRHPENKESETINNVDNAKPAAKEQGPASRHKGQEKANTRDQSKDLRKSTQTRGSARRTRGAASNVRGRFK